MLWCLWIIWHTCTKNTGRYEDALPLHTDCYTLRKQMLGEKHPDTLASMNNLGALLDSMGKQDDALPLHAKCLALRGGGLR